MVKELSIHFEKLETPVTDTVRNSVLEYVFIVNPPSENPFPGKKVVARIQDSAEEGLVSQGAAGAREWWVRNGSRVDSIANYVYSVTTCNEPNADAGATNAYMSEWINICRSRHPQLKIAAGHFSRGTPEPGTASQYAESLAKADFICFHEYWAPSMWQDLATHAGWQMWRYKKFMENLPIGLRAKPILITECGCDAPGGWKDFYPSPGPYLVDIKAYRDGLDDRVKAVFIYEAGPWPQWERFEVDVPLAEAIIALNVKEVGLSTIVRLWRRALGRVENIELELYLRGVVPSEMPASWPLEALKAQAVAARTYALKAVRTPRHILNAADLCDTAQCQAYGATLYARTDQAVRETAGETWDNPCQYVSRCGRGDCPLCQGTGGYNGIVWVGRMCQEGARVMAQQGRTYREILALYYVGGVPVTTREGLPEDETATDAATLAQKVRWWFEEYTRQVEGGKAERAKSIRYSLIKLLYRLERALI